MAFMKQRAIVPPGPGTGPSVADGRGRGRGRGNNKSAAIKGLPRINYYLPLVVTLLATLFIFLIMVFLTLVVTGNSLALWQNATSSQSDSPVMGALMCGVLAIVGTLVSLYFLFALVKGVRDLLMPVYYTRGTLSDKRIISGRLVGRWVRVAPDYAGPDLATATNITEEQVAASTDRSQIVQTRYTPPPKQTYSRRGSYLSPDRISPGLVSESRSLGAPGPRTTFRIETDVYDVLNPGDDVLVAHSRFLEHIYYVAHLRDGEWESFRNKALI